MDAIKGMLPIGQGMGQGGTDLLQNMNKKFSDFGNNRVVSGTSEFLNSNSMIAKVVFIILLLIVFLFLLRIGVNFLSWFLSPSPTPFIVDGMKDANMPMYVKQDPSKKGSVPIVRSNNEKDGLEYTYSVWVQVKDINATDGFKHVFNKGTADIVTEGGPQQGLALTNNCPGLYLKLDSETNTLMARIIVNTFQNMNEIVDIKNIPMKKWVNFIIRVEGASMDVYVNGGLASRKKLAGVAKQNYGDVNVNINNGYSGMLSDLRYWNYGLSIGEIDRLVNKGPNEKMADSAAGGKPPYMSLRWYLS